VSRFIIYFYKQNTVYEIFTLHVFRRVLFRSRPAAAGSGSCSASSASASSTTRSSSTRTSTATAPPRRGSRSRSSPEPRPPDRSRSEERRVGNELRSLSSTDHTKQTLIEYYNC